ncbi:MAG: TrkH family potassium uptake protein [Alphaproteobacteria bacterium]
MHFLGINIRPILFIVGLLLLILSVALVIPAIVDFWEGDPNGQNFVGACFVSAFMGGIFTLAYHYNTPITLKVREAFLLTSLSWVMIACFSAFPFLLSQTTDSITDALFEAVSALTTTGITIIKGLDYAPKGLLLWRSLLQWLGGLGIILMALTLLPKLKIGGMQLFYSDFSDRSEKIMPKVSQIAASLLLVYSFLTALCALLLWFGGMTFFEAFCHAMTTLATGGMSTSDNNIETFITPFIESVLVIFMILGGSTLLLFVRVLTVDWKAYFCDSQTRAYLFLLSFFSVFAIFWLWKVQGHHFSDAFGRGLFFVVSTMTTTGFEVHHHHNPGFLTVLSVLLIFIGGCTGSTSGGIKVFRFQVLYRVMRSQIYQLLHPHGVFIPIYNKRRVEDQVVLAILAFLVLYFLSYAFIALSLAFVGLDPHASFLTTASVITNTGIGFGPGNLEAIAFPTAAKWLMILGMLLGRLEFIALIVVVTLPFWRH